MLVSVLRSSVSSLTLSVIRNRTIALSLQTDMKDLFLHASNINIYPISSAVPAINIRRPSLASSLHRCTTTSTTTPEQLKSTRAALVQVTLGFCLWRLTKPLPHSIASFLLVFCSDPWFFFPLFFFFSALFPTLDIELFGQGWG